MDKKIGKYPWKGILKKVVMYAVLILFAMLFLVPFFFLLMGSFKEQSELFRVPFKWLPDRFSLKNYRELFTSIPFFTYFRNTMIIVVCNIIGSLLSCSVVAYGFARLNWPGRDKVFMIVMVTMILPYQVTLVPLFLLFTKLKWVGTFLPLTITCFFGNPLFYLSPAAVFCGNPEGNDRSRKDRRGGRIPDLLAAYSAYGKTGADHGCNICLYKKLE